MNESVASSSVEVFGPSVWDGVSVADGVLGVVVVWLPFDEQDANTKSNGSTSKTNIFFI